MKNENKSFSSIKYEYIIGILGTIGCETEFDLLLFIIIIHYSSKRKSKAEVSGKLLNFQQLCLAPPLELNVKKPEKLAHFVF